MKALIAAIDERIKKLEDEHPYAPNDVQIRIDYMTHELRQVKYLAIAEQERIIKALEAKRLRYIGDYGDGMTDAIEIVKGE